MEYLWLRQCSVLQVHVVPRSRMDFYLVGQYFQFIRKEFQSSMIRRPEPSNLEVIPRVTMFDEHAINQGTPEEIRALYNRSEEHAQYIIATWSNMTNVPDEIRQQLIDLSTLMDTLLNCWKVQFGRNQNQSQVNDATHNAQVPRSHIVICTILLFI